jgi:hypothetical protein
MHDDAMMMLQVASVTRRVSFKNAEYPLLNALALIPHTS